MATTSDTTAVGQGEASTSMALLPTKSVLEKLAKEDQERLNRVLSSPVEYMPHTSFAKSTTANKLFGDELGNARAARPWCNSSNIQLTEDTSAIPIATLTTEEEQRVFLRLNYARYKMSNLLSQFAGKRLTIRATREILWWHGRAVAAKRRIVQANVPLVLAMAKRTRLGGLDYADLISEGNMALLRSTDKFDCGRGFKFSTYACRAILKSFSRVAMRTSRYRGRFPTEFDPTLEQSHHQEEMREGHEAECVDELRGIMSHNTAHLNDVEVKVIQARFALCHVDGFDDRGPRTLEQVGLLIGVTKERVRQIQNKALAKLRNKLEDDFLAA